RAENVGLYTYSGKLEYYDGTAYYDSTQVMMPGSWYYVAAVEDGNNITFYINGTPDRTFTAKAFRYTATNTTRPAIPDRFTGTMDELRVSSMARSASWITAE